MDFNEQNLYPLKSIFVIIFDHFLILLFRQQLTHGRAREGAGPFSLSHYHLSRLTYV